MSVHETLGGPDATYRRVLVRFAQLAAMAAWACLASAQPSPSVTGRWAILGSGELEKSGLTDVLTAGLSEKAGISFVERAAVSEAARELSVGTLLGAEGAGPRLKLGRLLRADGLLILNEEHQDDERFVRLVISDCHQGARLWNDLIPWPSETTDSVIAGVAEAIRQVRDRYPDGVRQVFGIPPFVSKTMFQEYDPLQRRLAHILEGSLSAVPGVAVLEIEEARAIQHEFELAGGKIEAAESPLFIEGEFRVEAGIPGDPPFQVALRILDAKGVREEQTKAGVPLSEAIVWLRHDVPQAVLKLSAEQAERHLGVAEQVTILLARADSFGRLGAYDHSTDLVEACLLLRPEDEQLVRRAIAEYVRFMRPRERPDQHTVDRREGLRMATQRLAGWRRALALLEWLIRNGRMTFAQSLDAHNELLQTMDYFRFWLPKEPPDPYREPVDPAVLAPIDAELKRCEEADSGFIRGVGPILGRSLNAVGKSEMANAYGRWVNLLVTHPHFDRHFPPRGLSRGELEEQLAVLESLPGDIRIPCGRVLSDIVHFAMTPDAERQFTDADWREYLAKLRGSARPLNQYCGRLGELLVESFWPDGALKGKPAEALAQLEQWSQEFDEFIGSAGSSAVLEQPLAVLRAATQSLPASQKTDGLADAGGGAVDQDRGRETTTAPAGPTSTPAIAGSVRARRLHFYVRGRQGRKELLQDLPWANQPGFVTAGGYIDSTKRIGGDFDLLWNRWTLWIHREPGILDVVCSDRALDISEVDWDGERIWVATLREGILLFNPDGQTVGRIGKEQGLPPWEEGLELRALGPGRALVVGSFGTPIRAWCAVLEWNDGRPRIDVFHEAAKAHTRATGGDLNAGQEHERLLASDPETGFKVCCIRAYRDALEGGRETILVNRRGYDDWPLVVDPEARSVRVLDFNRGGRQLERSGVHWRHTKSSDRYFVFDRTMLHATQPGNWLADGGVEETLVESAREPIRGPVFFDGYMYLAAATWLRLDVGDLHAAERLGSNALADGSQDEPYWYFVSAHFGLVACNELGRAFQIIVDQPARDSMVGKHAVRVIDAETGAPLPDAFVEFETHEQLERRTTDANGLCEIDVRPGLWQSLSVYAAKVGFVAREVALRPGAPTDRPDSVRTIALKAAMTLGGIVQDRAGNPVEGAVVGLDLFKRDRWGHDVVCRTDAEGRWRTILFPTDLSDLRMWVSPGREGQKTEGPRRLSADSIVALREGRFAWRTSGDASSALVGAVLDRRQRPIAGAKVRLVLDVGSHSEVREVTSAADGSFRLEWQAWERARLIVQADGFAVQVEDVRRVDTGRRQVVLETGQRIRLRVVGDDQQPIDAARVYVSQSARPGLVLWEALTDAEGRVTWDGCPASGEEFRVDKLGYAAAPARRLRPSPDEHVLKLDREARLVLAGRVQDARTGEPVPRFSVSFGAEKAERNLVGGAKPALDFTDGQFRIPYTGPRSGAFRITAVGYRPAVVPIPTEENDQELRISLEPDPGPQGIVVCPDGKPARAASVCLVLAGSSGALRDGKWARTGGPMQETDATGHFEFPGQPKTWLVAVIHADGYAEADAAALASGKLVLKPCGRVEGRVETRYADDGVSQIELRNDDRNDRDRPTMLRAYHAQPDADGRFIIERVPAGEWTLVRSVRVERTAHTATSVETHKTTVGVEPGKTATVLVRAPGPPVEGRMTSPAASSDSLDGYYFSGRLTTTYDQDRPDNWEQLSESQRTAWESTPKRPPGSRPGSHTWNAFGLIFRADGRFHVEGVTPGIYLLKVSCEPVAGEPPRGETQALVYVPPAETASPGGTVDLGSLEIGYRSRAAEPDARRPREAAASQRSASDRPARAAAPRTRVWQVLVLCGLIGVWIYIRSRPKRAASGR